MNLFEEIRQQKKKLGKSPDSFGVFSTMNDAHKQQHKQSC